MFCFVFTCRIFIFFLFFFRQDESTSRLKENKTRPPRSVPSHVHNRFAFPALMSKENREEIQIYDTFLLNATGQQDIAPPIFLGLGLQIRYRGLRRSQAAATADIVCCAVFDSRYTHGRTPDGTRSLFSRDSPLGVCGISCGDRSGFLRRRWRQMGWGADKPVPCSRVKSLSSISGSHDLVTSLQDPH